ncbi:hypothetical protein D030_4092B, partial [Vibrio parahaemolyticus AQ3810]
SQIRQKLLLVRSQIHVRLSPLLYHLAVLPWFACRNIRQVQEHLSQIHIEEREESFLL